jgi:membrane dipeptidase
MNIHPEAQAIYDSCDIIDLHIDTFIWTRIFGYDLRKRHGRGLHGARFFSQVDLPRLREAKVSGGIWSITTNPFRTSRSRDETFAKNFAHLTEIFKSVPSEVALVKTAADYEKAKQSGKHAAWIGIQGGNAIDFNLDAIDHFGDQLIKVTLVHLLNSHLGVTSAPVKSRQGEVLTSRGREFVERLNAKKIFVDLAHINREGFFDALAAHDRSQPVLVSHTGVSGVNPHWRNLDDAQIRAVANTGGTIGIIYQSTFLGDRALKGRAESIIRHMEHVIKVAGEDFVSLGSDWDGMILPPVDMPTCLELPLLVQLMVERKWTPERIRKIMGGNFLRALSLLRPV